MQPVVEEYGFGFIVIGGRRYTRDIVVTPTRIVEDWWRIEGHRLQLDDVRDYISEGADAAVIGTGYYGYMSVDESVVEELRRRGMEVYVAPSREAVEKYNSLVRSGRKTMLFIHLTC